MKYLLVVIALFCGSVQADSSWLSLKNLKYTASTLLIVDLIQTHEISRNDRYVEANPVLGENPSKEKINLYFSSAILLNQFATKYLSYGFQKFIQVAVISVETSYIAGNASIGVKMYN